MLRNLVGQRCKQFFVPIRTNVFDAAAIQPIIDKSLINSITPDDERHFLKVRPPLTSQSNSLLYNERLDKFTKILMKKGEFSVARNIIEKAFFKIKLVQMEKRNKESVEENKRLIPADPLRIFLAALDNCRPLLKIVNVRKGGITYKCPVPMSDKEREFRATKLLLASCLEKDRDSRMHDALAYELIEAANNQGKSIKKKVDVHKVAEQNRAYAHYRWSQ